MAQGTCSVEGCEKTGVLTRTWCVNHYARYRRWGDPLGSAPPPREHCEVEGCTRGGKFSHGLCGTHYYRLRTHGDVQAHIPIREPYEIDTCTITGCERGGPLRRGWCTLHYQRWDKHGDPEWEPPSRARWCEVEGCEAEHAAAGMCLVHYMRVKRTGSTDLAERPELPTECAIEDCEKDRYIRDLCVKHYTRWKKYRDPLTVLRVRDENPPERCTLEGCVQVHRAKGLCQRHYGQSLYLASRDAIRARHAQHYRDNPEMYTVKSIVRRRIIADAPMDELDRLLSAEYRKAIKGDACTYCGAVGVETDHVFPVDLGGTEHWWNLTRACLRCNRSKGPHCGTWFVLKRGGVDESRLFAAVA